MIMAKDSNNNYVKIEDIKQQNSFNGISPIEFKGSGENLENYRIYGDTINGESVGDLITEGEHAGEYEVPVTVEGKNLLPNTATSQTVNGVTFTVNNDGSVTCNGTARGFAVVYLGGRRSTVVHPTGNEYSLSKGTYKLTGCPINGTGNTFYQEVYGSSINLTRDYGDGTEFNVTTNDIISVRLVIFSGYTCNNLIFYPMIRKADIEDDTYEPYHAPVTTNIYLPKQIKMVGNEAEYIDYEEQKQYRVRKNLFQNTATSRTYAAGITLTVNNDKSVVVDGTSNTGAPIGIILGGNIIIGKGTYTLSGCPQGGSNNTYKVICIFDDNGERKVITDNGNGATVVLNNDDAKIISNGFYISAQNCDNKIFYPMLRKANIEDNTYEPYVENTELDVTLPALPTLFGTNILSVNTSIKPSNVWSRLNDPKDILYVKDNLGNTLFSKYHEISGSSPLTYGAKKAGNLSNYQIYGNTINGESIGDLIAEGEHAGEYRVPVTVANGTDTETTNIYLPEQIKMVGNEAEYIDYSDQKQHRVRKNLLNEEYIQGNPISNSIIRVKCKTPIPLVKGELYTISFDSGSLFDVSLGSSPTPEYPFAADTTILSSCGNSLNWLTSPYTFECVNDGYISVTIRKKDNTSITPNEVNFAIQFEKNSTATSYEPYIENTEINVTLPALPTLPGTNTLSVDTQIQPSKIYLKGKIKGTIYGWHVDPDISDSSNAITYLEDAIGMIPASMGSTTFNYGSWENAFFMPKPCMLKSNGKVDYYLNPNDYTKKLDGTASDISNPNYDGNAMMEWPKIWFKYVKGVKEGQGYFYVANYKADGNFHCWCNYDSADNEIDHFYTAIYNGTSFANYDSSKTYVINDFVIYDNKLYKCNTDIATAESFDSTKWDLVSETAPTINKMRSLSGVRLTNNNGNAQTNTTTEVTRATANNTTSAAEWYIETFSDRLLINGLLVLMGKSLNTQAVFGRGLDTGGQSAKEAYVTGTLNNKGLFWGVTENGNSGVKIFGMENFWGCCWHRTAGLITNNHAVKLKLTYGTKDGSTVVGYNQTGNGYINNGTASYSNGYVQKMSYNKYGFIPTAVTDESQSTYYADYHYQNAGYTGTIYALFGGNSGHGLYAGAFSLYLNVAPGLANWNVAASLSCKPLLD